MPFCNSCGKPLSEHWVKKYSTTDLILCRRCAKTLGDVAENTGLSMRELWSKLFRRTTRKG